MIDAGILYGVAIGEAMAWPSRWQRARLMPAWTRRRARELATFGEEQRITDPVVPFGLNITPTALRSGPGAVTDWVADTAQGLAAGLSVEELWQRRGAALEEVVGPISAMVALDQQSAGKPSNGVHNPHGHDDSAACRALGVVAGLGPGPRTASVIEDDARRTNHTEGTDAARLIGDLALGRAEAGLPENIPAATRLGRQLQEMAALAVAAEDVWSLAVRLDPLTDASYSYGCLAGDTVAAAYAFTAWQARHHTADPMATIAASTTLIRQAGTLPALVGGLLGARLGADAFPVAWREQVATTAGCALPWLAGRPLVPAHPADPSA